MAYSANGVAAGSLAWPEMAGGNINIQKANRNVWLQQYHDSMKAEKMCGS